MSVNKLFSEFSLKKIWDMLLKHDKAMNSTILVVPSNKWVEQTDGTYKNTVSYASFKESDKLTVDLYDDGNLSDTQLSEYENYLQEVNIINGALEVITNTKPTQTITLIVKGDFESNIPDMSDVISDLNIRIDQCFQNVSNGKTLLASAITDMGVETDANDTWEVMVANIRSIETGIDTSDGTATAADITEGKIAYSCNQRIVGERPAAPKTLSGTFYQGIGGGYATYKYRIDFNPPFDVIPKFTYNMQLGNNDTTGSLLYVERDHAMFQVVHSHGNETSSCRITWTATVQ